MHTAYTFVHAHASHSEALTLTSQVCLLAFVSLLVYVISWKCTSLTFACVRDFLEMHFAYFYFSWKCASLTFAFPPGGGIRARPNGHRRQRSAACAVAKEPQLGSVARKARYLYTLACCHVHGMITYHIYTPGGPND